MIAVQLDKKADFDRLWKWSNTNVQYKAGLRTGYFAWKMNTTGAVQDSNSASDGEEWFVTALFFAAARWGNGDGIFNYRLEAQNILDAMLSKTDSTDSRSVVTNMFNKIGKLIFLRCLKAII